MQTTVQTTEVVIVGAGQSGLALSAHLSERGIEHIVLERARIAERWRTCRWDSLVANGPAWHDRFPTLEFDDTSRDAFVPKRRVVEYFETFAEKIKAPIQCGVEVTRVYKQDGAGLFTVETSNSSSTNSSSTNSSSTSSSSTNSNSTNGASKGIVRARAVVAATGSFQEPVIPRVVPDAA